MLWNTIACQVSVSVTAAVSWLQSMTPRRVCRDCSQWPPAGCAARGVQQCRDSAVNDPQRGVQQWCIWNDVRYPPVKARVLFGTCVRRRGRWKQTVVVLVLSALTDTVSHSLTLSHNGSQGSHSKVTTNSDMHIAVFRLGVFLRALRPARTGLRAARIKKIYIFIYLLFFHLQDVIAVVFSDSRCKNACAYRFVPMFSSIAQTSFCSRAGLWSNFVVHE